MTRNNDLCQIPDQPELRRTRSHGKGGDRHISTHHPGRSELAGRQDFALPRSDGRHRSAANQAVANVKGYTESLFEILSRKARICWFDIARRATYINRVIIEWVWDGQAGRALSPRLDKERTDRRQPTPSSGRGNWPPGRVDHCRGKVSSCFGIQGPSPFARRGPFPSTVNLTCGRRS